MLTAFFGALMFSPPTSSPSDSSTHTFSPSDSWTLELFDPHLLVSVMFSPRIFRPPSGGGGLIVTCDNWSNPLWQLVHPPCVVKFGRNVTTSLGVWMFSPSDSWTCTFPCFLGHFLSFFVLCSAKSCCYCFLLLFFLMLQLGRSVSLFGLFFSWCQAFLFLCLVRFQRHLAWDFSSDPDPAATVGTTYSF